MCLQMAMENNGGNVWGSHGTTEIQKGAVNKRYITVVKYVRSILNQSGNWMI